MQTNCTVKNHQNDSKSISHVLISALHWFSLLQLLLPQNILEHVVFPSRMPSTFSCSLGVDSGDVCWGPLSLESKLRKGPSVHVHNGRATEGNGPQVMGQKISDEIESTRFFLSVVPTASDASSSSSSSSSLWWSMHGVHRVSDRCSLISFGEEPGSLRKERMGHRQRGQGTEPEGIEDSEGMLVVEQR